ncbi:hypothetical protein [Myceligenerans cantabricum]
MDNDPSVSWGRCSQPPRTNCGGAVDLVVDRGDVRRLKRLQDKAGDDLRDAVRHDRTRRHDDPIAVVPAKHLGP